MELSVIIVNYNVKDLVLKCLESIFQFNHSNIEIIIVDNASKDGSVEAFSRQYPSVKIIANSENVGFPAANNQGLKIAKGDYLLLLNPDTEIIADALQQLLNTYKQINRAIILAPQLLNTDNSLQPSAWKFPTKTSAIMNDWYLSKFFNTNEYPVSNFSAQFKPDFASGAALFFSRKVFESIGDLDEFLFWIEDTDYCYRAKLKNIETVYYPAIQIKHHIGQSGKKNYNISLSNQTYNKIKFLQKHQPHQLWVLKLSTLMNVIVKIILFGCWGLTNETARKKAKAYIYTIGKIWNPPKGIA